ncbi:hypothetical protein pb186bvf_014719 [Paramecium bursaria]
MLIFEDHENIVIRKNLFSSYSLKIYKRTFQHPSPRIILKRLLNLQLNIHIFIFYFLDIQFFQQIIRIPNIQLILVITFQNYESFQNYILIMMNYICHCGKNEVKEIQKRFCCKECAKTDEYMNRKLFIKKFNKDIKDLKENRYQQILYLFNQFKALYQQLLISTQKIEEIFQLFLKVLKHQEELNGQEQFQEIENKILNLKEFFNLTETEIRFILKIRCLQHDNDQLRQILSSLQDIELIISSNLLINLRIIIQSMRIKVFQIEVKQKQEHLVIGKHIYCEDKLIYWTNYSYYKEYGQLQVSNLIKKNAKKVINMNERIEKILVTSKYIFCNAFIPKKNPIPSQPFCFIGFSKLNNLKKQFQIFLKFGNSDQDYFKLISNSLVILNCIQKGQFRLFCHKTKKIINILRMKSLIMNYSSILNQLVLVEDEQLKFYNFNTKCLKNTIEIPLLEDNYQYITNKQELISCLYQVTVQKIDYKNKKASIFKQFEASQFVYNELHDYLIIFNYDNEIIIFDSNYFLIKRFRWEQFLFSSSSEFILSNDMKYIFLRKRYSRDYLTIYRCQIAI